MAVVQLLVQRCSPCRGLCDNDYHDEVCRANYSKRAYDPPILYNLHHDPGEIYPLNTASQEYQDMNTITSVSVASKLVV